MKRHGRPLAGAGTIRSVCLALGTAVMMAASPAPGPKPFPPEVLMEAPGYTPLAAPDGAVEHYFTRGGPRYPDMQGPYGQQEVMHIRSRDQGRTWSAPEPVLRLPRDQKWFDHSPHSMYDRGGRLHLFVLDVSDDAMGFWHTRREAPAGPWTPLRYIGPSGPMNNPIQLRSGRIVIPVGYFRAGAVRAGKPRPTVGAELDLPRDQREPPAARAAIPWDDPTGIWESTTYYSDDEGVSWRRSPAVLTIPVSIDYPGRHEGACEPVVLELRDGRVWMLIRNQSGHLYESFSRDGVEWSAPRATRFPSSDSPASVVRLPGGAIVLVWNNCQAPAPRDGAFLYTGRDALHAALSADEGKTWVGYREVYRDPLRDRPHVTGMGDRGTSYACAVATAEGKVLVVSGQGRGRRRFILVDPDWLRATRDQDDFSAGLDRWSTFKTYGAVQAWGSPRTTGPEIVPHPSRSGARVLRVRRPDDKPGDGAVWNFPIGRTGTLRLRILLRTGFQGALLALTDRFFYPETIDLGRTTFALRIAADGRLGGALLDAERWHDLELRWQVEQRPPRDRWPGTCTVSIDGRETATLPQLNRAEAGVGYLRLNSTAAAVDAAGLLVERVAAAVGGDRAASPGDSR